MKEKNIHKAVSLALTVGMLYTTTIPSVSAFAMNRLLAAGNQNGPVEGVKAIAPEIPGFTNVSSTALETGKYYLVVSQDSAGNLYALYPNAAYQDEHPGGIITTKDAEGAFAVRLVNQDGVLSTVHEMNGKALPLEELRFIAEKQGDRFALMGSNELYLCLTGTMLAETPTYFEVSTNGPAYTLRAGNRSLAFNKDGDPTQYGGKPGVYNTNFWGSANGKLPIYLYTQDDAAAPVNKRPLDAALKQAAFLQKAGQADSVAALAPAMEAAQAVNTQADADQPTVDAAVEKLNQVITQVTLGIKPKDEYIAPGAPASGTTKDQPFASGTGTSENFRIPAIITLNDGTLLSAIDARWNHFGDACALDTIVSRSTDNGKTWQYSYANFFNDSTNEYASNATAFIDPVLTQGKDGTIYMMVDLFPGGVALNTAPRSPKQLTGYEAIDGVQRMVLYSMTGSLQERDNYTCYVGDFSNGYAPVIAKGDQGKTPLYYVDSAYYLYDTNKQPLYCQQLGADKFVKENVFFYNARLHVADATYLWMVKSTDGGVTWKDPEILNPQVRKTEGTHKFYGVGPGAGLTLDDGTVMLPAYTFTGSAEQRSSFIYTTDGKTWARSENSTGDEWSSESALVQIDKDTVRHFYRDAYSVLRYTDHTRDAQGVWHAGKPVETTAHKTYNNQLSAIRYSKPIDGKPAIIVSTAAGEKNSRSNGTIYTFTLNEDKTMNLVGSYNVTPESYGYSSITELKDGSIGVLYEGNDVAIHYENIQLDQLLTGSTENVAVAKLSKETVEKAQAEHTPAALEMEAVLAGDKVEIQLPEDFKGTVDVEVPVKNVTSGTVAAVVGADGGLQAVRKTVQSEKGLVLPVSGSCTIKILEQANPFSDIKSGDWFYNAVRFATSRELFKGVSSTEFAPNTGVTRGMLASVLYNLEGRPEVAQQSARFKDVEAKDWYGAAVAWAAEQGIVSGRPDGTFGPNADITREQLAVMLYRYAGSPEIKGAELSHSDAGKISDYAKKAMQWANENGIINGNPQGELSPQGSATRAEVAQMMMQMLKVVR